MEIDRSICPIMKSVQEIGDRWVLMIMREAFLGCQKFDEFQENLNISKSVLATKLKKMVEMDLFEKVSYQNENQRKRYKYKFTKKGKDLSTIILALLEWGNHHLVQEDEPTIKAIDKDSQETVHLALVNQKGNLVNRKNVSLVTCSE